MTEYSPDVMHRSSRLFLGLPTFVPLVLSVAILAIDLSRPALGSEPQMSATGLLQILMFLVLFMLWLFYFAYMLKNRALGASSKVMWSVAFVLAAPIALPLYWYWYVWKEPDSHTPA